MMTRLEAETFRGLAKLQVLNLVDNRLHYIDDAAFVGLARLRKLFLSRNCLSNIPRGTDQSPGPLELTMMQNPLTSLIAAEELKHVSRLVLAKNGLPCDCKLRDMKRWMTRNKQWSITCGSFPYKRIRWLSMDDLKCDYKVSVSSDYGTVTGNVSLTCQTDCQEGLDLTFSWIAPKGKCLSSTREYSRTYTDVRESHCNETPVTRRETKKTCYSVLHIPTLRRGMEGRYTCLVTANHANAANASTVLTVAGTEFPSGRQKTTNETSTRTYTYMYASQSQTTARDAATPVGGKGTTHPGPGLSPMQLVLFGLAPFVGCSLIVVVIAACVTKCKGARQQNNTNGHRNAAEKHNDESNGHFSGTDSVTGVSYENDDQFSDSGGDNRVHYENNDQFSDTEGASKDVYENDDQFSDTDGANGGQYENDGQFSDDAVVSKHPYRTVPHKETGKTSSLVKADGARPCDNQKKSLAIAKRRATRSRRRAEIKSNVLRVLAEVHAQAQASGHYDNCKNAAERSSVEVATSSDNVASDGGQYDNERPVPDSVTSPASETTNRNDDGSDSDQEYMTLPNHSPGEDVQREGTSEDRDAASTSACGDDVSENDYVTFPGDENSDEKTRKTDGRESDLDITEDSCDHTYVTFPEEEYADGKTRKTDGRSDLDTDSSNTEEGCDHTYVTFPGEENDDNVEEQQRESEKKDGQVSDLDTASSISEDSSDHTYVTFPDEENDEEQQQKRDGKVGRTCVRRRHSLVQRRM
ncbi:PREDICTED: uncharacterized protein LOC109474433 [Branchiostoma belcheri]|uniref:Uncharacterized protein LOC109474433 n=1 Tax=Branchiostoma belcheri TaxID=7741 RepID=A0A6P4ZGT7_BRABE|nr:PREDICTED: uncharacterized protein LOC109474433 [Branchiostoma belcheri]